jgi:hypothetical protein
VRPKQLDNGAVQHVGRPKNAEKCLLLSPLERLALSEFALKLSSHHPQQYSLQRSLSSQQSIDRTR